ncbi:exportin-5-like [Ciona intestinalis]
MDQNETQRIILALQTLLNPSATQCMRTEALNLCESYKSNPHCAEIGFELLGHRSLDAHVRYFGLQLIKHRVRHHWVNMESTEQNAVQSLTLEIVNTCPSNEVTYIKTGLAGVLTEIVKHTWPQQWPNMMDEVVIANKNSEVGTTEIIEQMLLDLAEDVALLQNVSNRTRGRDLRQALGLSAPNILAFLLGALKKQISVLYDDASPENIHLADTTLRTISTYAEWVKLDHIFMDDGILIEVIFGLLNNSELQLPSAECLLSIANRKGTSERKRLLILTTDFFVEKYAVAIKNASQRDGLTERKFQFLRCMTKLMMTFNSMIITQWLEDEKMIRVHRSLENYQNFFQVLFFLTSHKSRVIAQSVILSWVNLLRVKEMKKDETLQAMVPALINLVIEYLNNKHIKQTEYVEYEELEINDHDELDMIIKVLNGNMIEVLKFCTSTLPLPAAHACFEYAGRLLKAKFENVHEMQKKWEGLAAFIECVMSAMLMPAEQRGEMGLLPYTAGELLFETLQGTDCENIVVHKAVLNICSSLYKMLSLSTNAALYCKKVIDRAFLTMDMTSGLKSKPEMTGLRRQACSIFIRMAKSYSNIMIQYMEQINNWIQERTQGEKSLSQFEMCSLFEGMIVLSSEWKNFDSQNKLIGNLMATTAPIVQADYFNKALAGPMEFATAIGFCTTDENEQSFEIRAGLYYYISLTLGVLSRSKIPVNRKELEAGGFIKNGKATNPCCGHIEAAIDHMFTLTQLMSSMWSPAVGKVIHPDNAQALTIRSGEKRCLVFIEVDKMKPHQDEVPRAHWEKIQFFLSLGLDSLFTLLGHTGVVLGKSFYKIPTLQHTINNKALGYVVNIPTLRLKCLLRQFLAKILKSCPLDMVHEFTSPILFTYCRFMLERLGAAWEAYGKREAERLVIQRGRGSIGYTSEQEQQEEEEMLEEQLLRSITREHLELIINLCVNKTPQKDDEHSQSTSLGSHHLAQLTDLGAVLAVSPACENMLPCVLAALAWHDTSSCYKAAQILWPLLKTLMNVKENIFNPDITRAVFEAMLRGLHRHGQHDGCESQLLSLLLMFIQPLHTKHAALFTSIMLQATPDADQALVHKFFVNFEKTSEKQRKSALKEMLSGIIEQHVSQQFKEIPKMNILEPLQLKKRNHKSKPEDSYTGLAQLFQP